ncbi:GNAT family N-acetyltransferase [Crocinitomicaceae bacterium]|nr:GNAT family N-acetyltransferase [Crocinitomicaceae bacterium]
MEVRSPSTDTEWNDYYDLRYRILRKPLSQPKGSEKNGGDSLGKHLALYDKGRLVAITRLDQGEDLTSQVRFVAVENECQGKGYGKSIMSYAEQLSISQGNKKMILQARTGAVKFYQSLGYKTTEKTYVLFGQIQHYKMEKVY